MKGFTALILGIFATLAFSWMGLAFIPNLQIGHLEPQTDEEGKDAYPAPQSGMAERGRQVYVANGCFYCHSQQVRADYAGADIERKWGERRSAPRDYIFDRPATLGRMRMGPDLANIGHRAPPEEQTASPGASPAAPAAASPLNASPAAAAPGAPATAPGGPNVGAPTPATGQTPANSPPGAAPANAAGKPPPPPAASPNTVTSSPPSAKSLPPGGSAKPSPASSPPAASPANAPAGNPAPGGASPAAQQSPSALPVAASSPAASASSSPAPYSTAWHHVHLYSPRSVNVDSNMPAYKFLYVKRRIGGQRSAQALKLRGDDAPPDGWEVIPTFEANCLVAYLMSLDQTHPLKEVRAGAPPPSSPSPAKTP